MPAVPSVAEKIKLLVEWAPALSLLSVISAAETPRDRAAGALKLMRFVATKTTTQVDDDLVERVEACLLSPQGDELFRYIVALVMAISSAEVPE
jgi:hypothetical protein